MNQKIDTTPPPSPQQIRAQALTAAGRRLFLPTQVIEVASLYEKWITTGEVDKRDSDSLGAGVLASERGEATR